MQHNFVDLRYFESLKYHRFTPLGFKVIGIQKFEFVTKTQFLYQEVRFGAVEIQRIKVGRIPWFSTSTRIISPSLGCKGKLSIFSPLDKTPTNLK